MLSDTDIAAIALATLRQKDQLRAQHGGQGVLTLLTLQGVLAPHRTQRRRLRRVLDALVSAKALRRISIDSTRDGGLDARGRRVLVSAKESAWVLA